jgi:glycosyltransferase involved in cell wall biosynthesis
VVRGARKITFVSGQLDMGGQERSLYLLLRGLSSRFDADVVSLASGGLWAGEIRRLGIPVLEIPRRSRWEFGRLRRLIQHLRVRRPNLVYCMGFAANSYGRLAALAARVPRIVTGWRGLESSPVRWIMEILFARWTNRVVCNSRAVVENVLAQFPIPRERIALIVNGVEPANVTDSDRAVIRTELGAQPDTIVAGSVARLSDDKNPFLFLEAAALVRAVRPQVRFILVGGGPLETEVAERASALRLNGVRLLGEKRDARRLCAGFDIFLLTSHREGMPNALLEAMAAGVPCISTAVGGARDLIVDGGTGYLVPPGDAEALAGRVIRFVDSPELRRQMGEAGRARAAEHFSVEEMVRQHEALFDELMA